MAKVVLDFGTTVDMLNKSELAEALAEDARLRALIVGVKPVTLFRNLGMLGGSAVTTVTFGDGSPGNAGPRPGYIWSVMSVGVEQAAAAVVRLFAGRFSGAVDGSNRLLDQFTSNLATAAHYSKGQVMLPAGQTITAVSATANNILSGYLVAIEVPAERVGELLL